MWTKYSTIRPGVRNEFNLEEIKKRLQRSVDVKATPYLVSFLVEEFRFVYLQMAELLFMGRMI